MLEDGVTNEGQSQNEESESKPITQEQFTLLMEKMENKDKQINSLNSKVSEYQKELKANTELLEAEKNSSLSEQDRLKLEVDKLTMAFQKSEGEKLVATNKTKALELMREKGIDQRYLSFVPLDSVDGMIAKLEELQQIQADLVQQGAQQVVNTIGSNNVPTGGQPIGGMITPEQFKNLSSEEKDKAFLEKRIIGM